MTPSCDAHYETTHILFCYSTMQLMQHAHSQTGICENNTRNCFMAMVCVVTAYPVKKWRILFEHNFTTACITRTSISTAYCNQHMAAAVLRVPRSLTPFPIISLLPKMNFCEVSIDIWVKNLVTICGFYIRNCIFKHIQQKFFT